MAAARGRFTQSGPFAALMQQYTIEDADRDAHIVPYLIHNECGDVLCEVEDGDTMLVLIDTVLDHDCICTE